MREVKANDIQPQRACSTARNAPIPAELSLLMVDELERCIYCSCELALGVLDYCSATCVALAMRDNEEDR